MAFIIKGLTSDGKLPSSAKSDLSTDIGNPSSTVRQALDAAGIGGGASDADIAGFVADPSTATGAALASTVAGIAALTSDSQNLAAWGDSLTDPGKWIAELEALQVVSVYNGGRSGQSSKEIGMRQGGVVPKVTIPSGTIPASGSVAVTVDEPTGPYKVNVQGAMANPQYVGTIAGVHGTLVANIQGTPRTWSFTRTTDGTAVSVTGQRYFVSTEGKQHVGKEAVIWTGRNFSADHVVPDVAAMVDYLKRHVLMPRYTVVSILTSDTEIIGSAEYDNVLRRNAELKAAHGEHFVEVRRPLIDDALTALGITPTAQDLTDIANDTVPKSLRIDNFHLTDAAQRFVAGLIAEHRTRLGYDTTGPIVAANIGPTPEPGEAAHVLTATDGLQYRFLPKTLPTSRIGSVVTSLTQTGTAGAAGDLKEVVSGTGATFMAENDMEFLQFDGVSKRMYVGGFTVGQPFSAAIVYRLRTEGTEKAILSLANGTPSPPIITRNLSGNIAFNAGTGTHVPVTTPLGTGWHVAYVSANGASTILGVDADTAVVNPGTTSITGLRIGQGASSYSDIDVAEILVWNRALTAAELTQLRTDVKAGHPALV